MLTSSPPKCPACRKPIGDGLFPPNPTATAIAAWMRGAANRYRESAAAKEPFFLTGFDLGPGHHIDGPSLLALAELNLTQATLLEGLADRIERRSWPTGGPEIHVHHLIGGRTACNRPDIPGDWPPGHKWSQDWPDVTCPACLEALG